MNPPLPHVHRSRLRLLFCALPLLLATPGWAAPQLVDDPNAWPPPMSVGVRHPVRRGGARNAAAQDPAARIPWSDFEAYAKSKADLKVAQDPLFRPPTEAQKAAWTEVRKALGEAKVGSPARHAAQDKLQALLLAPDGASLVRLALSDPDPKINLAALSAARPLAPLEPRMIGFAGKFLKDKDPALVLAAVTLYFDTSCDAPLEYALDVLEWGDAQVQAGVLELVYRAGLDHAGAPTVTRVTQWLEGGHGSTPTRVLALRLIGALGWATTGASLQHLTEDKEPAVAAEALAALAIVDGEAARPIAPRFLTRSEPQARAGAIRALAQIDAMQPQQLAAQLQPLLGDKATLRDAANPASPAVSIAELARMALDYANLKR